MKKILLSLTSLSIIGLTTSHVISCNQEGKYMIQIRNLDRKTGQPIPNGIVLWEGDKRTIKRYAVDKSPDGDAQVKMEVEGQEAAVRISAQGNKEQYTKYLTDLIGFPPEPWWGTS
ncbi:hypothetical protein [Mesoplasma melaleucae]|uniref:Uncharacterized protein n=1 Tax=Mesoplasma melaleucae TaxID=81459 RepID=A0A2K8NYM6_9MOLU|nr:hypothetical protein [Mesoplasma melaleucae]ATZ18298.1 hypothetical protein EMELA_v1c08110 [Mesoplasma melaleucae]